MSDSIEAPREKFSVFGKHPDYEANINTWNYLRDLYEGLTAWLDITGKGFRPTSKTQAYIPKHPAESLDNWVSRINATYYDDMFAKALNRFVDLLFRVPPEYSGDGGQEFFKDAGRITSAGTSADLFCVGIALNCMLYGHTFILVDSPIIETQLTYLDYLNDKARPYWVEVTPQQLINWDTFVVDGLELFNYVVIEEIFYESHGLEHELINQVRILRPNSWEIWRKRKDSDGREFEYLFDSGVTNLPFVPLVPVYGSRFTSLDTTKPMFKGLADKNRTLYQLTSDHQRKVSLCCNPTPVLKDQMRSPDEPLEIGPNSFINLRDPNGSFSWQEPLALSIEQSRKALEDLKTSINFDAAQFLSSPSDRQSAAATGLLTNPLEATLATFSRFLAQGIERAIKFHCAYFGDEADIKVEFQPNVFPDQGKDSQAAFAIQGLYKENLISRELALQSLENIGIFPSDFDLDKEMLNAPGIGTTRRETT